MSLKYEHKNGASNLEIEGSVADCCFEAAYLINRLYNVLHRANPIIALIFRQTFTEAVAQDNSPMWTIHDPAEGEITQIVHCPNMEKNNGDV